MGVCTSRPKSTSEPNFHSSDESKSTAIAQDKNNTISGKFEEKKGDSEVGKKSPFFPFYSPSPAHYFFSKKSPARSPASGTPRRFFKKPFPPPSPAKHIRAVLARRHGSVKPNEAAIPEGKEVAETGLDKNFGFSKNLNNKYEMGEEVGRGHFGYTCRAKFKKGELKGQEVAIKVIPKSKMTTAIAIEDVRKEDLNTSCPRTNYVKEGSFWIEYFQGVENTQKMMQRLVVTQILNVVAFCHLQGVVHRDLKPENFLFKSKEENSQLKAIDFGLSDFVKPDERLNDIVGSAYYVAPEVLHRAYNTEADVWSIGVIAYILMCGSRPFWARTESGIFRAVVKAEPTYEEQPWPTLSSEAKDFVKCLLSKDPRKRMTAAQALCHPWIKNSNDVKVHLDILILKLLKAYMRSSPLRKAALRSLSKTLTVDQLFYLKEQFALLEPSKNGTISLDNIKEALTRNATDAMKESRIYDFISSLNALQYRRMDFEEFCAAALSVYQLEALDKWEQHARCAYELFEKDGNRTIMIEELASELGLGPSVPVHAVLHDWIRHTDGKLSFLGFIKLLHGVSSRSLAKVL
ncbi:CDPK-related kinase 5 [Abeliophyllum distichum]|uniref:CDPK-related kinase 5 n=1 Tax=Abeliophyllum distichum TaxID=126358 RepID=A0ABD1SJ42_9LAMI